MSSIRYCIVEFLDGRSNTISMLKDIKKEVDNVAETASTCSTIGGVLVLAGGAMAITSTFFPPAAAVLGPVGIGIGAAASSVGTGTKLVAKFAKGIQEKNLNAKAERIIAKDRKLLQCLKESVKLLRDLSTTSRDTVTFLTKAAELGVTTTTEIHKLLNLSGTAKALEITAKVASVMKTLNEVVTVVGPVVTMIALPIEFISILEELIASSNGDLSKVSKKIQEDINTLQTEYAKVKETLRFLP